MLSKVFNKTNMPYLVVFFIPFLFYYRTIVPNASFSLAIINDFNPLYYKYKLYLIDMLSNGHFPLWSPTEACGYPFFANPFTQAFYPLNALLVLVYKVLGGYSIFDHQTFSVLGISIFSLGIYFWLNLLVQNKRAVIFAAILIALSFKLGEILRFPNAIHTAAWIPWILYGISLAAVRGRYLLSGFVVFISSILLLTGGYPYYVYYCLFLLPPYILLLLIPWSRVAIVGSQPLPSFHNGKFIFSLIVSFLASFLFCSPYIVKMQQLLQQTVDRSGSDYEYTTLINFDFADTIGSLLFPPAAQAEGWYYFSIAGLILLLFFGLGSCLIGCANKANRGLLIIGLFWFVFISSITYGKESFIFNLFWNHFPSFSGLRVWGRMNIILLPIIALLLARAYHYFEATISLKRDVNNSVEKRTVLSILSVIFVISLSIIATQIIIFTQKMYDIYWLVFFKLFEGMEWLFIVSCAVSIIMIISVLFYSFKRPFTTTRSLNFLLIIFLSISIFDLYPVGSHQWMITAPDGYGSERKVYDIQQTLKQSFHSPRTRVYDTITLPSFNVGWIINWYYDRYLTFDRRLLPDYERLMVPNKSLHYGALMKIKKVNDPGGADAYAKLMGIENGKRVFFTKKINHSTINNFLNDSFSTEKMLVKTTKVIHYDGDALKLSVDNIEDIYVSFIDNWDPDWMVSINGESSKIEKLFGTFKSVQVDAGKNDITFKYKPF